MAELRARGRIVSGVRLLHPGVKVQGSRVASTSYVALKVNARGQRRRQTVDVHSAMKSVARAHAEFTSSICGETIAVESARGLGGACESPARLDSSRGDWTARETISFGIRPLKIPGSAAHDAPWTLAVPPWTSGVHARERPSTGALLASALP